jgi:hypothetical protein
LYERSKKSKPSFIGANLEIEDSNCAKILSYTIVPFNIVDISCQLSDCRHVVLARVQGELSVDETQGGDGK